MAPLATAYVRMRVDGTLLKADALKALQSAELKRASEIKLKIDTQRARLDLSVLQGKISKLDAEPIRIRLDTAAAKLKLALLQEQVNRLNDPAKLGFLQRLIGGGGGGLGGLIGGGAPGGAAAGGGLLAAGGPWGALAGVLAGLIGLLSGAGGIIPLLAAAGMGAAAFGALALPTITGLTTALGGLSTATSGYRAASKTLDIAIHKSPADLAAYQAALKGLEPDLRGAAALLANQHVVWQNLSPAMQKSVIALSNNSTALRGLLPDQRTALTALLAQRTAWTALSPAQQKAAKGIQSLQAEFSRLAARFAPLVLPIINQLVSAVGKLLPYLAPFAAAFAKAFGGALKQLGTFLGSQQFQNWLAQMLKLVGPATSTIFAGIGRIAVAVGHLLTALISPDGLAILRLVFQLVGNGIQWLANAIKFMTPVMSWFFRAISRQSGVFARGIEQVFDNLQHAWDNFSHAWDNFVHVLDNAAHAYDNIGHALGNVGHALTNVQQFFAASGRDIGHWSVNVIGFAGAVLTWFSQLPGRVVSALSRLAGDLLAIGRHAMSSLWNGFKNVAGGFLHWLGGLVSKASGLLSTLTGGLLGSKSSPGPAGGAPAANAALARRMVPQWSTGANWAAWNNVAMAESGWNQFARNASSGAYGIPQALPPTKMPFAAQAAGGSQPGPQIGWMASYMQGRYGGPVGAWNWHLAHGWYDHGGWLPTGPSITMNRTGRRERVTSPAAEDAQVAALDRITGLLEALIGAVHANAADTAGGVAAALGGPARQASFRAAYSPR